MDDLTIDEMRRIQRTLRKRFHVGRRTNIIDIGFGAALKRGRFQPNRGLCLSFLVRHKKTPRRMRDRIPPSVEVRVKRGRRFQKLEFPTDVVAVGGLTATGRRLEYRTRHVTTGVIVAWRDSGNTQLSWGLLTVGHVFPRLSGIPPSRRKVKVVTTRGNFFGELVAKSDRDNGIDAAIALVERQELIAKKLMTNSQAGRRIVPRPLARLQRDRRKTGATLRTAGKRSFLVHAFFPRLRIPDVGELDCVVSAMAPTAGTFAQGTSGTSWLIVNQAACLQVAGRAPDYRQGFGQALSVIIDWAASELQQQRDIENDSFRTVATF